MLLQFLQFSYSYVLPFLLAFTCIFRSTFASFVYLILYVAMLLQRPSVYRSRSKTISWIILALIAIWSTLIILTQLVLGIMVLTNYLPRTSTSTRYIQNVVGFYWNDVSNLQYVQMTIPDTLIFLTSIITLGLYFHCSFATPMVITSPQDKKQLKRNSRGSLSSISSVKRGPEPVFLSEKSLMWDQTLTQYLHGYLQFMLCVCAALLYSSIPTLLYLIGSFTSVIALAFGFSIYWLEMVTWPLILIFTVCNAFYLYLSQFEYGSVTIAQSWLCGTDTAGIWISGTHSHSVAAYLISEFILLLVIIYVAGFRVNSMAEINAKRKILRARVVSESQNHPEDDEKEQLKYVKAEPEDFSNLARFFSAFGWPLAFVAYLFACIFTPSILQGITLFVVMFGTSLLRTKYLRLILPALLVYSTLFLFAQGIYNLDFSFGTSEVLVNLGFMKYEPYIAYIGIQCIPISLLAAYWRYSRYYKKVKNARKLQKSESQAAESSDNDNDFFGIEISRKEDSKQEKTNKKRQAGYSHRITLYIEEGATFVTYVAVLSWKIFLKNSYYFTLLALLLCSLLDVNLFNFGYLCFFVLFLVSRKIAMMFWILLVIYTECVIMVIFLWQLSWTEHLDDTETASLFGLQHYEFLISGLFIPLLIFIFSLVQLGLIRVFKQRLKKEGRTLRDKNVRANEFDQDLGAGPRTRILLNTVEYIIDSTSLWVCYLALYLVSMIGQYDLFSLYYLLVFYLCAILHEIFEDAKSKVQLFWVFTVIVNGAILIAVYFFQFESVANWVISIYPESVNQYLTLSDIGLSFGDSTSDVYLSLLGASGIFFLSVLQLRQFLLTGNANNSRNGYEEIPDSKEDEGAIGTYKYVTDIPAVAKTVEILKRAIVLHTEKISFLIAYAAVIILVSLVNDVLLLFITVGLLIPSALNSIGLIVIVFCELITVALYISEFEGFLSLLETYLFDNDQRLMEEWMEWFGVPPETNLFLHTIAYNLLILSLLLERYGSRWAKDMKPSHGERCALFEIDREQLEDAQKNIKLSKENPLLSWNNLRFFMRFVLWYIANFYWKHGIYLYTFSLLVTLFIRYNIWSIIEIGLVAVCLVKPRWILRFSGLLTFAFSCLLIFQYSMYLGSPPNFEDPPWYSSLDSTELTWFTLGPSYNINLTYADFFTLLLLSYLFKSYHFKGQHPPDSIQNPSPPAAPKVLESVTTTSSYQALPEPETEKILPKDSPEQLEDDKEVEVQIQSDSDLSVQSAQLLHNIQAYTDSLEEADHVFRVTSWRDRVLYMTCRYSFHFILLFMFMAATAEANVLSCGYVAFALFFLYKDAKLYQRKNKLWRWGRVYNFAVMVIVVVYQFPYFPDCIPSCTTTCPECDPYALQPIIGLYKFSDTSYVFSSHGILFDLIIFLLMALQAVIFDTTMFERVANHIVEERKFAVYRAKLKYLLFLRKEERAIRAREEETKQRAERLEKIHRYRKEKQYLLSRPQIPEPDPSEPPIVVKRVSEVKNRPILGVPEKPEAEEERETFSDEDYVELGSEEKVEEEITQLYCTIEEFLEPDTEQEEDTLSLTSDDLETYRDKIIKLKNKLVSYGTKFYNALYHRVVKYLYSQTFQNPDPDQSKFQTICRGFYYYCLNRSHILCYLSFILNNLVYANLLSLVYPTTAFLYALMESPVPSRGYWRFCIIYTYFVILLKFIFQFTVFCVCYSSVNWYFWCVEPFCSSDDYPFCSPSYQDDDVILRDLPQLFGVIKIVEFFALGIGLDLLVLFTLLLHRNVSKKSGLWLYLSERKETIFQRFLVSQDAKKTRKQHAKEKKKDKKERIKVLKKERKKERKKQKKLKKLQKKRAKREKQAGRDESEHLEDIDDLIDVDLNPEVQEDIEEGEFVSLEDVTVLEEEPIVTDPIDVPDTVKSETSEESTGTPLQDFVAGVSTEEDVAKEEIPIVVEDDVRSDHSIEGEYEDLANYEGLLEEQEHEVELSQPYLIVTEANRLKSWLHFYYYSLSLHKATAKDYYVPMVSIECIVFFYMVLCQNAFSYNPPDDYSFILLESRIPTSFFFILLIQFCMIVLDRVIYLFRSITAKIIMQYVSLFYYTLLLFFILPNGQGKQFDEIWVLIIFYSMKCVYWWISALQICEGYPANIQKRWIAQSYGFIHRYIYEVYLAIPFLFELRSMLDWAIFDTTLNFFQWMKLEDIYRNLYRVKCKRKSENTNNWYDKQSWLTKNLVGALAFIGLIALLWFPLFLLSSANPTNQPNSVVEATFEISVAGFSPFYHNLQDQEISSATSAQFDAIRKSFPSVQGDEASDTQIINLHLYSDQLWVMTPPSKQNLYNTLLNNESSIALDFDYSFRREQPPGSEVLVGRTKVTLATEQREALASMVMGTNETQFIVIPQLIPRLFKLPLSGSISTPDKSSNNLDIILALNRTIYTQEVTKEDESTEQLEILLPYWSLSNRNISQHYVDDEDDHFHFNPQLVVVSAEVPSFFSSFAASGIIGLYVTIVLAVGRFLRMGVSDLQYNIVFEDLPEPIDLITMCEDIFMARETGDLRLERDLYNEIIQLYRSPESLIAVTRRKEEPPPGVGTSL